MARFDRSVPVIGKKKILHKTDRNSGQSHPLNSPSSHLPVVFKNYVKAVTNKTFNNPPSTILNAEQLNFQKIK